MLLQAKSIAFTLYNIKGYEQIATFKQIKAAKKNRKRPWKLGFQHISNSEPKVHKGSSDAPIMMTHHPETLL